MKRIFFLKFSLTAVLLAFILIFTSAATAQSSETQSISKFWLGSYEFFDAEKGGPKNQPGNFVTYTLIVSENGDRLAARFTADGTQISDDYQCRVEADADSVEVFFVKDLGGMEEGKAEPLKKDDLVFTLTKTVVGKKTKYLFRKGKYEIYPLSVVSQNKIYFAKKK